MAKTKSDFDNIRHDQHFQALIQWEKNTITTLLEQAFTAASALPQTEQEEIAHSINSALPWMKLNER
jgi:hypothetical protein